MDGFNKPGILEMGGNLKQNFEQFKQEVTIYFSATETDAKSDKVQVARLLNLLGKDALKVYNTMDVSKKNDAKINEIFTELEKYCSPKRNLAMEHFKFFKCTQREGESFNEYYTSLKSLIETCEFGNAEKSLLRTQIILGLYNKDLQEKLLRDDPTLDKTVECCQSAELAEKARKQLEKLPIEVNQINKISGRNEHSTSYGNGSKNNDRRYDPSSSNMVWGRGYQKDDGPSASNRNNEFKCLKCSRHHRFAQCPAFGKVCGSCGGKNHFASNCRNPVSKNSNGRNQENCRQLMYTINHESSIDDEFQVSLNKVDSLQKEWLKVIKVNGTNVKLKLDTGAHTNVINLQIYESLKSRPKLETTTIKLESYGGHEICPVGTCMLTCETKYQTLPTKFVVVRERQCQPILGLEACIGLKLIKRIDAVNLPLGKEEFIKENREHFSGIGCFPDKYKITLRPDSHPKAYPSRRVPLGLMGRFKDALDKLIKNDIIEPVNDNSLSEWVSNIVIVEKPDKSLRICLDPQNLNKYILRNYFHIPTLDELRPKLAHKRYYTVLDLKNGFYHIQLDEESSKLCTFSTPFGLFSFKRLPFGISSAPEIFQKINMKYFGDIEGLVIYFDDFVICHETREGHDKILAEVLQRAKLYNVKFNHEKVQFCQSEVRFLGLNFNEDGVAVDKSRIESILNLKNPNNKKELMQIMGMINYLRDFIPNLSELTGPLRTLLRKDSEWSWYDSHTAQLKKIKDLICEAPILANYDPKRDLIIQCDSSKDALGYCLLQEKRPVAFGSRSLTESEKNYAQIEKELLAVYHACEKSRLYIYGRHVKVHSDHQPLVSLMKKNLSDIKNNRLKRIKLKLLEYNLDVQYLPGKFMYIADLLSRNFLEKRENDDPSMKDMVHTLEHSITFTAPNLEECKNETSQDKILMKVLQYYKEGWPSRMKENNELMHYWSKRNEITVENELVFYNNRLVVPVSLRRKYLGLLHETHLGITKTKLKAGKFLYWPGMMSDIQNIILACMVCLRFSNFNTKDTLIQRDLPKYPFQNIAIDIATHGNQNYLIIEDYYSRWLEVEEIKNKTSRTVIEVLKQFFCRFGIPEIIFSDNMPFDSWEYKDFAKEWNVRIVTSSPHFAQSNGLAEKGVGIAKQMLKKCIYARGDYKLYLLNYRTSPLASLGVSPAQIVFNREVRTKVPARSTSFSTTIPDISEQIIKDRCKQKLYYDRSARNSEITFSLGEKVLSWNIIKKIWEKSIIVEKLPEYPRSYRIRTCEGRTLRRNSKYLKKCPSDFKFNSRMSNSFRYDDLTSSRGQHGPLVVEGNIRNREPPEEHQLQLVERPTAQNNSTIIQPMPQPIAVEGNSLQLAESPTPQKTSSKGRIIKPIAKLNL